MTYKLYKTTFGQNAVITVGVEPQVSFLFDPANTDYQAFLRWCKEGNTPEPADQ